MDFKKKLDKKFLRKKNALLLFNDELSKNSKINYICSICLEVFRNPVVTSCGHIYCWICIYEWYSTNFHECPQCRKHVSLYDLNIYDRNNPEKYIKYTKPIKIIRPSLLVNTRSFGGTTLDIRTYEGPSKRVFFFAILIFCLGWEFYRILTVSK
ncbi:E3 ubiquitin-protein ligase [Vairimorpha necatrix]|uniref:RING-type E3 ubiquitin transferase n=1 Tax=Vairimorpha necatrix TaxID=6039 RepID=A0AAX4J8V6_9MICR